MFEEIITNQARRVAKLENPAHEEIITITLADLSDLENDLDEPVQDQPEVEAEPEKEPERETEKDPESTDDEALDTGNKDEEDE
jgi:hypothetical protein